MDKARIVDDHTTGTFEIQGGLTVGHLRAWWRHGLEMIESLPDEMVVEGEMHEQELVLVLRSTEPN